MTLSENQALNSFDFLEADDVSLLHRMSRISFSEGSEPSSFSMSICILVQGQTATIPHTHHQSHIITIDMVIPVSGLPLSDTYSYHTAP